MDAVETKQQFNPQKNYKWEAEEKFEIDGKTFDILYNFLQMKVNTKEVQEALITHESFRRLQEVFIKSVEEGKIVEDTKVEEVKTEEEVKE